MKLHTKSQLIITTVSSMVIFGFIACKKLDLGAVTKIMVGTVTIVGDNSVSVEINIFDLSDDVHPDYGVCYSTNNTLPTTLDSKVSKGALKNKTKENVVIQGLQPGIKIYIRSFVMNGNTPQYSFNVLEAIPKHMPTISDISAVNATATAATLTGVVNANTTTSTVVFEFGTTTAYGKTAPAIPGTVTGTANTSVSANLTGLQYKTTYHYRLKANCAYGTVYSADSMFVTSEFPIPSLTTATITNVTAFTATSGGTITDEGGFAITSRGVCWSTNINPTITDSHTNDGSGLGTFTSYLSGLSQNTYYYVRAYATNSHGTAYGNQVTFNTVQIFPPTVTTSPVSDITKYTAACGGNVTSDGGNSVTARGVCWSTSPGPTIGNSHNIVGSGTGQFSSTIIDLSGNTAYYVRAYATNSQGTSYGNQVSFTTIWGCGDNFTDLRDNKVYGSVQIGTQCWMKQNLNVGTRINESNIQSDNNIIEKYCYNNSETNCNTYGGLYQWNEMMQYSTAQGVQGICAPDWHIPTNAEWTILSSYLGGESVAGGKLKESGIAHWNSPNTGATNSSGFTGLPGGYRSTDGSFIYQSYYGYWWSSTQDDASNAWYRYMSYGGAYVYRDYYDRTYGFSVRCLKD